MWNICRDKEELGGLKQQLFFFAASLILVLYLQRDKAMVKLFEHAN